MTTAAMPLIGASSKVESWDAIDWRAIKQQVQRLQMRIAKATRARWCATPRRTKIALTASLGFFTYYVNGPMRISSLHKMCDGL